MSNNYNFYKILYLDDEKDNLDVFRFNFRKVFNIITSSNPKEALEIVKNQNVAIIVTDQRMPDMSGLEFLTEVKKIKPHAIGIILTAYKDPDVLLDAIRLGYVYRFIVKPWDADELSAILNHALEFFHLKVENERLNRQLKEYAGYLDRETHQAFNFGNIVGSSEPLQSVLKNIEKVAPTNSTVLIRGETGTGKELVAHAIHLNSQRANKPFVKVNCAALPTGILESELFGHEKGAFTGAVSKRLGRFELADQGTLFLDEIGDLPMEIQVKLLRVFQEQEFERVGGEETIKVNVRIITATHQDLETLIKNGKFRADLYYRLNVFPLYIPPLHSRKEDIYPLVKHFVAKYERSTSKKIKKIESSFMDAVMNYHWPGNVRELENIIERAIILSSNGILKKEDLQFGPFINSVPAEQTNSHHSLQSDLTLKDSLDNEEKNKIIQAMEQSGGNVAAASRILGINRSTLYYRIKKHNLLHILPGQS